MGKKRKKAKAKKAKAKEPSGSWEKVKDVATDGFEWTEEKQRAATATKAPDEDSDSAYQQRYYQDNQERLSREAKERWQANRDGYRERGLERARRKRAVRRSKKAQEVFEERTSSVRVCGECDQCKRTVSWTGEERKCGRRRKKGKCKGTIRMVEKPVRTKKPRRVEIDGQPTWVYSSGSMALKCGKSPPTMRTWIEERVIPGYTYKASKRYWFSMEFMEAVAEAVRKVLFLDGRGKLTILRRYVLDELARQEIEYVPFD